MIFKKFIIIFLLILTIFSFSSVRAENINVTSSSAERMQTDIDYLKQLLKNNNINNMEDLKSFFHTNTTRQFQYLYIEDAGHTSFGYQYAYFYFDFDNISNGVDNYSYYGIQQNSFTLHYKFSLCWGVQGDSYLYKTESSSTDTFTAPACWLAVRTADLFTKDSSQIVASAVENINNSVNNLSNTITEDNSSQDDINLGTHNDEMSSATDSIKNSNLYSKFDNIIAEMDDAFTYNDDEVSTIPISFYGKNFVLRSDAISSFLKNNNLGFVVLLWQSILWFSLFYTMFLFIRKLYKSFAGGNPVDDVSNTLSNEDSKIVGGF